MGTIDSMTIKDSEDNHAVYGTRERMESGQWHLPGSDELRTEQLRDAGTLVTTDVPDNSLVLGLPGRVMRKLG